MTEEFRQYALSFLGDWSKIDNPGENTNYYLITNNFEGIRLITNEACKYALRTIADLQDQNLIDLTKKAYDDFLIELDKQEKTYYENYSHQPSAYEL